VTLDGADIRVLARPEVLGFVSVPLGVTGALEPISSGDRISFLPARAAVADVSIPHAILDFLFQRLNPLIDLSGMPLQVRVDRITIANDVLTLTGTIPPESILKAAMNSEQPKN
jgi:hypothetical protein